MDISSLFGVKGKIIVVSGGSRGLGKMISTGFVTNGAKVYIASRDYKACLNTAAELNSLGAGKCIPIQADFSNDEGIASFASKILQLEPAGIDVLINNAGVNWAEEIDTHPISEFENIISVNVTGVFFLSQKLIPALEKRGTAENPSRIINIGSIAGLAITKKKSFSYNASKAAIHHMSRAMALALAEKNITVNNVAPGFFDTLMMAKALEADRDGVVRSAPLNRLGRPTDIAAVCIYLASPGSAYLTGSTIKVDGGTTIKSKI
ncbi:hypothetical protein BB560_000692 [Smittium megazygosporum]|uniref:Gluconate 5-dehydrogenase n=1 Tax=Smittium megazygosporum TaxID=133381 RepID=A0A2T9ZJM8_9FUNG|nr:hypothetical protein BB560_000692 [Smittium megazygosporum]